MEKKKSLAEELFPRREAASQQAKYDILSSIFPPHPMVDGKCSSLSEWKYPSLDAKPQGSSGKNHSSDKWNGNPIYLCELPESCLMSSSVHYGARDDFIPDSSSTYAGMACNPKRNEEDESDNSDVAIRGDWWQGSYYY